MGNQTGPKPLARLNPAWTGTLALGDVLGKIVTLVGFPGAVVAIYLFHAELVDLVTAPDVTAELREVTLRCAYKFQRDDRYKRYDKGEEGAFGEICRDAPLATSFSYRLSNHDAINRDLKRLRVEIELPVYGKQDLGFAYDIEHVLQNGFDVTTRRPWAVRRLAPRVTTTLEALAMVEPKDNTSEDIPFGNFVTVLKEKKGLFAGNAFQFSLYGLVGNGEIKLGECKFQFPIERIDKFLDSEPDQQFQLTGYCKE